MLAPTTRWSVFAMDSTKCDDTSGSGFMKVREDLAIAQTMSQLRVEVLAATILT
jgi:hypothetical protein